MLYTLCPCLYVFVRVSALQGGAKVAAITCEEYLDGKGIKLPFVMIGDIII